jgi:OOP family OmpA-OmpF porin
VVSDGENISRDPIEPALALSEMYGERLCIHSVHVGESEKGRNILQELAQQSGCGIAKAVGELQSEAAMKKFITEVFYSYDFVDSDGDGVADSADKCPRTPKGVKVAANGCPLDSDGDGVPDYLDKCLGTARGAKVNKNGCPLDSDGDGVLDSRDKCPRTPKRVKVDANGCPLDSDGDGVADYMDKCPDTPKGVTVNRVGCWVIRDLKFDYNKWDIKPEYYAPLNRGLEVLKMNPTMKIEVQGHTDSKGSDQYNLDLSQKRANAVRDYLISKGVDADRLTAKGLGESTPIATNDTPEGRAENRRVEFKPISY